MVIYTLTHSIRSNILNYHAFAKDMNITYFVENLNAVPCACSKFNHKYIDNSGIMSNAKLKKTCFQRS